MEIESRAEEFPASHTFALMCGPAKIDRLDADGDLHAMRDHCWPPRASTTSRRSARSNPARTSTRAAPTAIVSGAPGGRTRTSCASFTRGPLRSRRASSPLHPPKLVRRIRPASSERRCRIRALTPCANTLRPFHCRRHVADHAAGEPRAEGRSSCSGYRLLPGASREVVHAAVGERRREHELRVRQGRAAHDREPSGCAHGGLRLEREVGEARQDDGAARRLP